MTITPLTPSRAARRQSFLNQVAEYLEPRVNHPEHRAAYAHDVLNIVDALGFALPAAIDDPPPPAEASSREHRLRCLAEINAVIETKRLARNTAHAEMDR